MAKMLIIGGLLIIAIGLLLYIAAQQPATITIPVQTQEPAYRGEPTPRAQEPIREPPTPKKEETTPKPGGVPIEAVYPQEINFYVNQIIVPPTTDYEGANYIPIKEYNIKTFAGTFGPYPADPTPHLKVILCAEFYKMAAAPNCETVPITYRDGYASFAKGYKYDEYIGGMAAKDYIAYYDVYLGEKRVAGSNKAVIRTIKT